MAITEAFSGTATISTTEYSFPNAGTTLTPQTDDGVYQALVDLTALAAGDSFRLRVLEKCRAGDTQRLVYDQVYSNVQAEPLLVTPSFVFLHGWDFTIKKLQGTDRTILWSIRKVA